MRRPLNSIVVGISLLCMGLGARTSGGLPEGSDRAHEWFQDERSERVRTAIELESLLDRSDRRTHAGSAVPLGAVPLDVYSVPEATEGEPRADLFSAARGLTARDRHAL
jgi:hypothetical protein